MGRCAAMRYAPHRLGVRLQKITGIVCMNKIWTFMRSVVYPGLLFALLWAVIAEAPDTKYSSWPSSTFYIALFLVLYHCTLYVESEETFKQLGYYNYKSFFRDILDIVILVLAFSSLEFLYSGWVDFTYLKIALCICFLAPVLFRSSRNNFAWLLDVLSLVALGSTIASFFVLSLKSLSIILWVLFVIYIIFILWRSNSLTNSSSKDALPRAS